MGELEKQIKELIRLKFGSQAAFCESAGISPTTLSTALAKGITNTTVSTFRPIVTTLGLDPMEAMEGRFAPEGDPNKPALVPLYDAISANTPIDPALAEGTFPIPAQLHASYPDAFVLRVQGNSMNRILPAGSLVLVDPCTEFSASDALYVVAEDNAKVAVKRVLLHDNGLTLAPDSNDPSYRPLLLLYSDPAFQAVSPVGRIVWHCSPVSPTCEAPGDSVRVR